MSKFENYILAPIVAVIMLIVVIIMFSPMLWVFPLLLIIMVGNQILKWINGEK